MTQENNQAKSTSGFTLIELLVVISIIGILSAMTLQSYTVYKQMVYDAMAYRMIHDTTNAITAGRIEMDESGTTWFQGWSDASGQINGNGARDIAPGLVVSSDTRLFFWYDGTCGPGLGGCDGETKCCMSIWIYAFHCNGTVAITTGIWNNGDVTSMEVAPPNC